MASYFNVLARDKFRKYIPVDRSVDYVEWYAGVSEQVVITEHIVACRDPKDDKFLSVATSGKADCIIAGDSDLLDLVNFKNIPICRPAEFIRLFVNK